MAKTTIQLPPATPHAYLAWVAWWTDVEELIGSDLARFPDSGSGRDSLRPAGIVAEHLSLIELEAKSAIEGGRDEIAPTLTAAPEQWNQWIQYGRSRREWLEALALKKLPNRGFPDSMQTLWNETMRVIQAVVSDHLVLHNVSLIPEDEPGRYLLRGELEVANTEAVAERLEGDLRAGRRLELDLSGLKFIDSQGVRMLFRLATSAAELELTPVIVVAPSVEVTRVLDIAVPGGIPGLEIRPAEHA
jgi:anti-anti-sigma factor